MVAMPSLHFFRWVDQLKDSGIEVFWFDITGAGNFIERINWVHQITDWKFRWNFPGRVAMKKKFPLIYKTVQKINERKLEKVFEEQLREINPDLVHSFALYVSCTPIASVMNRYPLQKWIYSSWGSDLYYFQHSKNHLKDIKRVLPRVDYLFTDCRRDHHLALEHGFRGKFLGVFPGGGGFDLKEMQSLMLPHAQRNLILIKGYEGRSGRAIPVLRAVAAMKQELLNYNIVVFGADKGTEDFVNKHELVAWPNFEVQGKISHREVLELMGKALFYIGNSNSDGMPNTLLEALCMNVFPIQSNPGGVTEEVVEHGVNGLLISNCEDSEEILYLLKSALSGLEFSKSHSISINSRIIAGLDRKKVKKLVVQQYNFLFEL